jgi:hypothetical protein
MLLDGYIGPFLTRADITILPADPPHQQIGWKVSETIGIGVFNSNIKGFSKFTKKKRIICY